MRISKSDWHKIGCSQEDPRGERGYCAKHRKIFYWCQTADLCQGKLFNGGECPACMAEYRMATERRLWDAKEIAHGRAA